jgi:hypothetical protein
MARKESVRSVSAQRRYWRRRLQAEEGGNPVGEQVLIARTGLRVSGLNFPAGSILPADLPPKTIRAFVDSKLAHWEPRSDKRHYPSPVPVVPVAAPTALPTKPMIVFSSDICESWLDTEAAAIRIAGSEMRANDWLMSDRESRDLYVNATKEACIRASRFYKKPSVTPNVAWSFLKGRRAAA